MKKPAWYPALIAVLFAAGFLLLILSALRIPFGANLAIYNNAQLSAFRWLTKIQLILQPLLGALLVLAGILLLNRKIASALLARPLFRYWAPAGLWMLLPLLFMELVLRLAVYSKPLLYSNTNWFGMLPAEGASFLWAKEGYASTRYTRLGEIATPLSGGPAVLILGDSFVEALQVPDDLKFTSLAEGQLHSRGIPADLHNFGRSGAAMADYVSLIPAYRQLYPPSAIVLQLARFDFTESFDPQRNNYFTLDSGRISGTVHRYSLAGPLVIDPRPVFNSSLMLLDYGFNRIQQLQAPPAAAAEGAAPPALAQSLAAAQMDLLLQAAGDVPLIFLLLPGAPYIAENAIVMQDPNHQQLLEFVARYPQVTVVDPLPEFQQLAAASRMPMGFWNSPTPGLGHLNRTGNAVVGRLLADALQGVLP